MPRSTLRIRLPLLLSILLCACISYAQKYDTISRGDSIILVPQAVQISQKVYVERGPVVQFDKRTIGVNVSPVFMNITPNYQLPGGDVKASGLEQTNTLSFSTGIHGSLEANQFVFSSGIYLTSLGSGSKYIKTTTSYDSSSFFVPDSGTVIGIQFDTVSMDTVILYDSMLVQSIDTNQTSELREIKNRFTFFDIPLELGYSWNHKKWTVYAMGGFISTLVIRSNGNRISSQAEPNPISSTSFKSLLWSYRASLYLNYDINKRLGLSGNLHYRRFITQYLDKGEVFSLASPALSIGISATYHFKK